MREMTTQPLVENFNSKQVFAGIWHNQHNSEMDLMVAPNGHISGSFRVKESPEADSKAYPLIGFVSGDVLAFCVNFAPGSAVTSWIGHIKLDTSDKEGTALETLWHMAVHIGNRPDKDLCKSIFSGADMFHRGPHTGSMLWHKSAASHPFPLPE
jgi:hypothetical protein